MEPKPGCRNWNKSPTSCRDLSPQQDVRCWKMWNWKLWPRIEPWCSWMGWEHSKWHLTALPKPYLTCEHLDLYVKHLLLHYFKNFSLAVFLITYTFRIHKIFGFIDNQDHPHYWLHHCELFSISILFPKCICTWTHTYVMWTHAHSLAHVWTHGFNCNFTFLVIESLQ